MESPENKDNIAIGKMGASYTPTTVLFFNNDNLPSERQMQTRTNQNKILMICIVKLDKNKDVLGD